MNLEQFIIEYKISQVVLSGILGISQGTFNEKLRKTRHNKFNESQKSQIKEYLDEMVAKYHTIS